MERTEGGFAGAVGVHIAGRRLAAPRTGPPDPTALSRDPAVVRAYEEDPLVNHEPLPDATVAALGEETATFMPRAAELTVPFLLMHGYADRMADPEASRALHKAAGSEDKVLVLWEGLFHQIFNEPADDRELPLERLTDWLEQHAPG